MSARMKPETLEALRGSIEKWQKIVDGTGEDRGAANCPLCLRFLSENGCQRACTLDGERCPVYAATGYLGCRHTPYELYHDAEYRELTRAAAPGETQAHAEAELAFLKSLLPEEKL